MNEKNINLEKEIIKKTFDDNREIKCITPKEVRQLDSNIYQGGDVFTTVDGDFVDLEIQLEDFDEDELIKKIEFAEGLYEKHQKHVSVYLLCPKDIKVTMKECVIKSEADFIIRLACINEDACEITLKNIKNKLKNNIYLSEDDIYALSMLQVQCKKEERNYYRKEYFKIINKLNY